MAILSNLLRVGGVLLLVTACTTTIFSSRYKNINYPLEVHQLFRNRVSKTDYPKVEGVWSTWSPWSSCSRPCGGGVMQQSRHCVSRPISQSAEEKKGRPRQRRKIKNYCVGLYKRFHLCNVQECQRKIDFRGEQCASFNSKLFRGRSYIWEPFHGAVEECALNCRAVGMGFYATLNKTVVDGTSCAHPLISAGRRAPTGTRGICVDGKCKSVASNGVIGAVDETPEECLACLKGSCRSISGLYTKPDLPPGYSLVAQIPQGACSVVVQQLKHTTNHIALKNAANGSYILNGDGQFTHSRVIEGAGTTFTYKRQDSTTLESVTAAGPLTTPVDIMIVNQQPNPGIKYGYAIPVEQEPQIAPPFLQRPTETRKIDVPLNMPTQRDEARPPSHHPRRRGRRRFIWKISGVSACSKSCGGGVQTAVYSCVREHSQATASDKRCNYLEKPSSQQIRCNIQACPPHWGGVWEACTTTCGSGVQLYRPQCQQETTQGQIMAVVDAVCGSPKPDAVTRPCSQGPCDNSIDNEVQRSPAVIYNEWIVGPWSPCSVSCGTGQRTRTVSCPSPHCNPETRPAHADYCDSGVCSAHARPSLWLVSEWSQCSEGCGTGTQSRLTACTSASAHCDATPKPETTRACSSERKCMGEWFLGPWSACSEDCVGPARQTRDVLCVVKVRGQPKVVGDMVCSGHVKPEVERGCHGGGCPERWFVGEWGRCEGLCPVGTQRREVRCLDAKGSPREDCVEGDRPVGKRTCTCEKSGESQVNKPVQDEPGRSGHCIDKFSNCQLAVRARLCQYEYYIQNCCQSCGTHHT